MNENLKTFVDKMLKDEELAGKMAACRSADEAYAVASKEVGGFTKEEFVEGMSDLKSRIDTGSDELTADDLAAISGGLSEDDKKAIAAGSCLGAGTAMLGAALAAL